MNNIQVTAGFDYGAKEAVMVCHQFELIGGSEDGEFVSVDLIDNCIAPAEIELVEHAEPDEPKRPKHFLSKKYLLVNGRYIHHLLARHGHK